VPVGWRFLAIAILGAVAAGGVGWLTSMNPNAAPAHVAVLIRVLIIATLIGTGLYALTSKIQARMGGQLIAVGFLSTVWLLNGSSNQVLFSISVLCSVLLAPAFAYLMLAYPSGRLHSRAERQLIWGVGAVGTTLWIVAVAMSRQPPLTTGLAQCGHRCPDSVFSLGSATNAPSVLKAPILLAWLAVTCGPPLLLTLRLRSASALLRRALVPVWLISVVYAVVLVTYLVSRAVGPHGQNSVVAAYLVPALPLAFLVGLSMERALMSHALAEFVSQLGRHPDADPQALIASVLGDRSLRIAHQRPTLGTYVDSTGATIDELPGDQAITWVERERRPVAAVMHDPDLAGHDRFLQAAGAVALMRLERTRLEADLKASTAELAASRVRMAETAHHERRRLERDLHDGVQQQLVGLRIKLDQAAEVMQDDPATGNRILASIGRQMDETLKELRLLAHGLYPELLHDRGVAEALRAAARDMPAPAVFRAAGIGRYAEDVEVSVYYCCLEALQNTVKHAGPDGAPTLTLWHDGPLLCFEVRDSGIGFDANQASSGAGLINMRDRIQTVGGMVEITSGRGRGTSVRGSVPIAS
jgi:signal transduction histidine kinase